MEFNPNKTPVEIIKEGGFDGTYFKTSIQLLRENGTKVHGKILMN